MTGCCLCEGIRFEVRGALGPVRYCHCSRCRRATGSAFSTNARVRVQDLEITSGRELISEYEISLGVFRAFCSRCGSPVYARTEVDAAGVRVRLGTLEGDPGVRPAAHVWVGSKAACFEITDELPQFETNAEAAKATSR